MTGVFRYCPYCAVELQPFFDEERLRLRCPVCGWVQYRNPTAGVAVVVLKPTPDEPSQATILLGKRRSGGWCIPCGHVEWDESIEDAARREFLEETGLVVELQHVLAVMSNFHNPEQHTVGVWYLGRAVGGHLQPGGDLVEVRFFGLGSLPDLIFPTDSKVIQLLGGN